MPEAKDSQLVGELIRATREGKVRWIPTAKLSEFTAAFGGKFSVIIGETSPFLEKFPTSNPPPPDQRDWRYELTLLDETGATLHRIEDASVKALVDLARRPGLRAGEAIDEILADLKSR